MVCLIEKHLSDKFFIMILQFLLFLKNNKNLTVIINLKIRSKFLQTIFIISTMQSDYHFLKLNEIKAAMPNSQTEFSTMGVIFDCTNPHRKDHKKDYCMRLKIFDPSFPNLHCLVFLYGKTIQQFPKKIKVGDILILHKYGFQIWNQGFQAKKHFKVPGAFFRFASGDPTCQTYSFIDSPLGEEDPQGKILAQLISLRKASHKYLKENSVPLFARNSQQSSDFDVILKVMNTERVQDHFYKIYMTNNTDEFQINYCDYVDPGVYKIRSVADYSWKDNKCQLLGNDYTCFLQIPIWMKSYSNTKQWDKFQHTKTKTDMMQEKQSLSTRIITQEKSQKRRLITLKDLTNKDSHNDEIRVICEFVQVFTPFEKALKKYDAKNNLQKNFESQQGEYIYNIHFVITDDTLQGQLFNVYIYSFDGRGNEFLPGMDPKKIYGKNILAFKEKYEHFVNRILEETDIKEVPLQIVLSPLHNGRDTIYRIVDTELIM